jgi:uncharacterized coiled-coil protein SlyX
MSIQSDGELNAMITQLWKHVSELESAVLELTTRVRVLETTRTTLSLKKNEKETNGERR